MYCNHCATSIVDLHPNCSYELCLSMVVICTVWSRVNGAGDKNETDTANLEIHHDKCGSNAGGGIFTVIDLQRICN
ncbi:hypothetical protein QYF36_019623 [Acer negundo]|nr:hypothetical protein QYF36_019623 [Acer negundo]